MVCARVVYTRVRLRPLLCVVAEKRVHTGTGRAPRVERKCTKTRGPGGDGRGRGDGGDTWGGRGDVSWSHSSRYYRQRNPRSSNLRARFSYFTCISHKFTGTSRSRSQRNFTRVIYTRSCTLSTDV